MTHDNILDVVAVITGVPVQTLKGPGRSTFIVGPKFLAYYLLWHLLGYGSVKIGRVMCKDHTTICSGIVKARKLLAEDPVFAGWYAKALDRLNVKEAA